MGHFDLVIIDEAHRSVYQKYGAIFAYFDSLLSGLTATPREEIDRNTYELFEREIGLPTDEYGLGQAVSDGFLVPFKPISVPLRFPREGINYDDLSDDEKAQWELPDWEETVQNAGRVDSGAVSAWLFNADTVDKGLEVRRVPAWSANALARVVKTPKLQYLDSGLLSALLGLRLAELVTNRTAFGPALECYVYADLLRLASWSEDSYELFMYRDKDSRQGPTGGRCRDRQSPWPACWRGG